MYDAPLIGDDGQIYRETVIKKGILIDISPIYYLGIDPGLKGGVAIIDEHGSLIDYFKMPINDKGIDVIKLANILSHLLRPHYNVKTFMEKVHSMPGQGVVAMFTFGYGVGRLHAVLELLGYEYELVRPQEWKQVVLKNYEWKAKKIKPEFPVKISEEEKKKIINETNSINNKAKRDAKLVSCRYVNDIFPRVDLTMGKKAPCDGIADAICLAQYGRLKAMN